MEPILTLPYSEWLVAESLMKALPASEGYAIYAPLSRQQKGVDLLVFRRNAERSRAATIQVKFSRAYETRPSAAARCAVWYRSFPIPEEADFFILAALYPNITGRGTGAKSSWWAPIMLVFQRDEMSEFMKSLRTRSGKPDRMFYFQFSTPEHVIQTRGAVRPRDVTELTFANRVTKIKEFLAV